MRAVLDANVLYSIALTDTLLTLADAGLFGPLWTEQILEEAERSALRRMRKRGEDAAHLRRRFQAMRAAFEEATIDLPDYWHLIPEMPNHDLVQRLVTSGAVRFASRMSVPAAADSR